ncbi:hypothetical protein [Paenibacillus sp. BC26]|uniref:hypothetical protein n=1 Tax=Paenibacillus sp. BC26 TaxID=1881032 RepID=UPI0008E28352|nr:hypothetical protein [Paenibacillus sp. BC26]SFS77773.1 hypothetical protein SAMN05428962_2805 [Paenibacillus sp. BC26]
MNPRIELNVVVTKRFDQFTSKNKNRLVYWAVLVGLLDRNTLTCNSRFSNIEYSFTFDGIILVNITIEDVSALKFKKLSLFVILLLVSNLILICGAVSANPSGKTQFIDESAFQNDELECVHVINSAIQYINENNVEGYKQLLTELKRNASKDLSFSNTNITSIKLKSLSSGINGKTKYYSAYVEVEIDKKSWLWLYALKKEKNKWLIETAD